MLLRELEILKTLDHPNIIKVYEIYQDSLYFYIVMYTFFLNKFYPGNTVQEENWLKK